jgi:hypothetical protein
LKTPEKELFMGKAKAIKPKKKKKKHKYKVTKDGKKIKIKNGKVKKKRRKKVKTMDGLPEVEGLNLEDKSEKELLDLERTYRNVLLGQHYYDFVTEKVDPKHLKDTPKLFNFVYLLKLMALCIPILTFQSSARVQIGLMISIEVAFLCLFFFFVLRKDILKSKFIFWMTVGEEFCILNYLIYCMIASYNEEGSKPVPRAQAYYELLVIFLLLTIMIIQILQVVIVMIDSIITFMKARKLKKLEKAKKKTTEQEQTPSNDELFAKKKNPSQQDKP